MLTCARSSITTLTFRWASTAFRKISVSPRTIRPCTQRTATFGPFVVCTLSISPPCYLAGAPTSAAVRDEGRKLLAIPFTVNYYLRRPLWLALASQIPAWRRYGRASAARTNLRNGGAGGSEL